MTTEVVRAERIEFERGDSLEVLAAMMRVFAAIERGSRITAIEVEISRVVRVGRSATTPPLPPSSPSSQQER